MPRREPGRIGIVGVLRLVLLEVVLGVVFFVVLQELWTMIVGGALGLLAVLALFGRSDGRWWSESLMLWARYRLRSGQSGEQREDPRLTALCELAPDLLVEDVDDSADGRLGMGSDGAGWFAVLELATGNDEGARPPMPLAALAKIAAEAEQAGVVIQVVSHSAATGTSESRDQVVWVAIRLDANAVAESTIDHSGSQVDVPAVLAEITHRVERLLRRRGIRTRPLRADEVVDALARSCDLLPTAAGHVHEDWDGWNSSQRKHACFWLRTWPDPDQTTRLLATLMALPAALVSVALLVEPVYEGTNLRCIVRVATSTERYEELCSTVIRVVGWTGAQVTRLDGQHAPAVYASAPSGGGAR